MSRGRDDGGQPERRRQEHPSPFTPPPDRLPCPRCPRARARRPPGGPGPRPRRDARARRLQHPPVEHAELDRRPDDDRLRLRHPDLRTDHQFVGQKNTFHVRYGYAAGLDGSGYDPHGHQVDDATYPYFQQIRTGVIDYVRTYPDKTNFYEVFGTDIAQHVMQSYPQLTWIDLTIDVPGYGGEPLPRTATIHVQR